MSEQELFDYEMMIEERLQQETSNTNQDEILY